MKTVKLPGNNEALRWRRMASAITTIEIGPPTSKKETNFMSNPRRIVSHSSSARILPEARFEVDFFQAAKRRFAGSGRVSDSQGGFAPTIAIHACLFGVRGFMHDSDVI